MLLFNYPKNTKFTSVNTFQNISCYCLTLCPYPCNHFFFSFQNISCYCLTALGGQYGCLYIFQNISCYCLTFLHYFLVCKFNLISKHLMLLFNPSHYLRCSVGCRISKHLMLLFNLITFRSLSTLSHFKTSHVIV